MITITMICCLAFFAVAVQAADHSGHYYLSNVREMASELLLKPGGTFQFMMIYGAADYWAEGTWTQKDGAVLLTSAPLKEDQQPFRLLKSSATKNEEIRVCVLGDNGRGVPNIDVAILHDGGNSQALTDSTGVAMFPREGKPTAVAFAVRVYQFESEPIQIDPAHDEFKFHINGKAITEVRFEGEKITADHGALVMLKFGPEHPMRYEKQ